MNRVTVFGKPGGGKSTFSKALSQATGIDLFPLDLIEFEQSGEKVDPETFKGAYNDILARECWIIDGFGSMQLFEERLELADTLIYIDLPYLRHYWWVTKRLLMSPFVHPEGWPDGSSALKGTLASYQVLRHSPQFWNQDLLDKLRTRYGNDKLVHLTSVQAMARYVDEQSR